MLGPGTDGGYYLVGLRRGFDRRRRRRAFLEAPMGTGSVLAHTLGALGGDLWLSEHTVKFHLTNIYRKLGVSNRSAAVRYAYEHALTQPSTLTRVTA